MNLMNRETFNYNAETLLALVRHRGLDDQCVAAACQKRIEAGESIVTRDEHGYSALDWIVVNNYDSAFDHVIAALAIEATDPEKAPVAKMIPQKALEFCVDSRYYKRLTRALCDIIIASHPDKSSALLEIARQAVQPAPGCDIINSTCQKLIAQGARACQLDDHDYTALDWIIVNGHQGAFDQMIAVLLADADDPEKAAAAKMAAQKALEFCVDGTYHKPLTQAFCDIVIKSQPDKSLALIEIVRQPNPHAHADKILRGICQKLIAQGARVGQLDGHEYSAIDWAVSNEYPATLTALIEELFDRNSDTLENAEFATAIIRQAMDGNSDSPHYMTLLTAFHSITAIKTDICREQKLGTGNKPPPPSP